jgi:uncharacterized OsmC-like protein
MSEKNVNGVNTQVLQQAVNGIKSKTEMSHLTFNVETEWTTGFKTASRTVERKVGGTLISASTSELSASDFPQEMGGSSSAPSVCEICLGALGSCITQTIVAHATARGIQLERIRVDTEGEVDVRGLLGLDENVRPGAQGFRAKVYIESKADRKTLEELIQTTKRLSPAIDTLTNGTRVTVELAE